MGEACPERNRRAQHAQLAHWQAHTFPEKTMLKQTLIATAITGVLALGSGFAAAADQERTQQAQKQQRVYGSQLMTKQERIEQRSKMRAAKTAEEREQIRKEHHERMKERAKERGVTLSDEPPARGGGMGSGAGRNR
ncbi:MAG: hypothetical protein PHD65_04560 [Gallionella sp.]|nr:hypothetical protein [Gallionella sp.]